METKEEKQAQLDEMIATQLNPALASAVSEGLDVGKMSDGYHTFDQLYEHRIELYIALCKMIAQKKNPFKNPLWLSLKHSDGTEIKDWFILGIGKQKGQQITYHLPEKYLGKLASNPMIEILDQAPEFDGHTSADVLERLKQL